MTSIWPGQGVRISGTLLWLIQMLQDMTKRLESFSIILNKGLGPFYLIEFLSLQLWEKQLCEFIMRIYFIIYLQLHPLFPCEHCIFYKHIAYSIWWWHIYIYEFLLDRNKYTDVTICFLLQVGVFCHFWCVVLNLQRIFPDLILSTGV